MSMNTREFLASAFGVVAATGASGALAATPPSGGGVSAAGAPLNVRDFGAKGDGKTPDTVCIDDVKVQGFSGHGIFLDRIWLFIIRHSQCFGNLGCGCCIRGWDGFVTDNQFSDNGSHGFGCLEVGATVMFTANRVECNRGYGLYVCRGDAWNVTGNSFDRNWSAGLCLDHVSALTVTGNLFRRCGKDSRTCWRKARKAVRCGSWTRRASRSRAIRAAWAVTMAARDMPYLK